MVASGMDTKTASVQYTTLSHIKGYDALEVYKSFHFSTMEHKDDIKTIV